MGVFRVFRVRGCRVASRRASGLELGCGDFVGPLPGVLDVGSIRA